MCPSAPRVCSEPGGQKPVLSLSLDRIGPLGTNFNEILIKIPNFSFSKNASENIICEMAAILSKRWWVKYQISPANLWFVWLGIWDHQKEVVKALYCRTFLIYSTFRVLSTVPHHTWWCHKMSSQLLVMGIHWTPVQQTVDLPVIWESMTLIWPHSNRDSPTMRIQIPKGT